MRWRSSAGFAGLSVLVALLLGGALGAPRSAGALSFTIPEGSTIVDMDLSGDADGVQYDGTDTVETLSLGGDIDRIDLRLEDGSLDTIELSEGQVHFSMNIGLDGTVDSNADAFGDGSARATLRNGSNADFTVWDLGDDGDTSDDLLFSGNFLDGLSLDLTVDFGLANGSLGESGYEVEDSQAPDFEAALPGRGTLFSNLSQIQQGGSDLTAICDVVDSPCPDDASPGLKSFSAQPNLDFTPVPEPATAALLGGALTGLGLLRRARRRS